MLDNDQRNEVKEYIQTLSSITETSKAPALVYANDAAVFFGIKPGMTTGEIHSHLDSHLADHDARDLTLQQRNPMRQGLAILRGWTLGSPSLPSYVEGKAGYLHRFPMPWTDELEADPFSFLKQHNAVTGYARAARHLLQALGMTDMAKNKEDIETFLNTKSLPSDRNFTDKDGAHYYSSRALHGSLPHLHAWLHLPLDDAVKAAGEKAHREAAESGGTDKYTFSINPKHEGDIKGT